MGEIISVNPFRCRMWDMHQRSDVRVTEESCKAEIESFEKHGQLVPALGRPVTPRREHEVELIYGMRRLFVARHLNRPLQVELRNMPDRDALIAMDIENRQRTDLSCYERGRSYAQWLEQGYFRSEADISRALKVSLSKVYRLLRMARLPDVVIRAFGCPTELKERWALDLMNALGDPTCAAAILDRSAKTAQSSTRVPPVVVYRQLLNAARRAKPQKKKDEIVKDADGKALFRIRRHDDSIAILFPMDRMSTRELERIRHAMLEVLDPDQGLAGNRLEARHENGQTRIPRLEPRRSRA